MSVLVCPWTCAQGWIQETQRLNASVSSVEPVRKPCLVDALGKGTHALESLGLHDRGYFGPGEAPTFDCQFFNMPHDEA